MLSRQLTQSWECIIEMKQLDTKSGIILILENPRNFGTEQSSLDSSKTHFSESIFVVQIVLRHTYFVRQHFHQTRPGPFG